MKFPDAPLKPIRWQLSKRHSVELVLDIPGGRCSRSKNDNARNGIVGHVSLMAENDHFATNSSGKGRCLFDCEINGGFFPVRKT